MEKPQSERLREDINKTGKCFDFLFRCEHPSVTLPLTRGTKGQQNRVTGVHR